MPAFTRKTWGRGETAHSLRAEMGAYIRELRDAKGMTQAELAEAVGLRWYTNIGAIEIGRNSLPPERYMDFARALGVDPKEFGERILQTTDPWAYAMLFAKNPAKVIVELNQRFPERVGKPVKKD